MSNSPIKAEIRFRTSEEIRERLRYHAHRLGTDINNLVREGALAKLAELDQQENTYKTRKKYGIIPHAPMPTMPETQAYGASFPPIKRSQHTFKSAFKLPVMKFAQEKPEVPEKMKRSFRKWAEFVEEVQDLEDREKRLKVVNQEIIDKCSNDLGIYSATKSLFEEFLEQREAAHIEVNRDLKIEGDVD